MTRASSGHRRALIAQIDLSRFPVEVNPDGTRAHVLEHVFSIGHRLTSFDLSANANGGNFPTVGTATPLVVPASNNFRVQSTLSADGTTLILLGDRGLYLMMVPN